MQVERLLVLKKFQLQNSSRDHVIRLIEDGPISIGSIRKEHTAFIKVCGTGNNARFVPVLDT